MAFRIPQTLHMANQQATPPPSSPRAPKIQQQSWDDCGSPPIDLFDPNKQNMPESPPPLSPLGLGFVPPRSPKGTRKLPTLHDPSSGGPKRIVRKFDSTHSEPATSCDYYSPPLTNKATTVVAAPTAASSNKNRIYTHHTGSLGEARSPKSVRSFVFDETPAPTYEKSKPRLKR